MVSSPWTRAQKSSMRAAISSVMAFLRRGLFRVSLAIPSPTVVMAGGSAVMVLLLSS
ncbi:hypothetical protein [Nonomuraea jabiensis]|uniref:hypothetical protein n=1 Tax=Nonomuraea jabiensis TaxID=882448 RepID=UPI00368BD77B